MDNKYYTPQEAAALLGRSLDYVYRRCENGLIEAERYGKRWLVLKEEFDARFMTQPLDDCQPTVDDDDQSQKKQFNINLEVDLIDALKHEQSRLADLGYSITLNTLVSKILNSYFQKAGA